MEEPVPAAAETSPPLLWIDATRPAAGWRLWGMNLVERLLREASRRGLRRAVICVTPETATSVGDLRRDLPRLHAIEWQFVEVADTAAAYRSLAAAPPTASVLVLEGDVVHDERVLDHLLASGPGRAVGGDGVVAAHLTAEGVAQLADIGQGGLGDAWPWGAEHQASLDDLGTYVPELRLTMAPFLIRLASDAQLRRADRLLFHRTFKGVIDAVARYGYYHFVRFTTRWLSRTTVSPNALTLLSIAGIWAAVPLFATGHIGWGAAAAWLGVILDSVDGKLARLTVNLSDAMGSLEHAAAMPGLALWFVALGWHLSAGQLLSPTPASISCWVLLAAFLVDKLLSGGFKALFGYELFDARRLDAAFHLVAARRNVHLLLVTVGVVLGEVSSAFEWMAFGMVLTLLFHGLRFVTICLTAGDRRAAQD